MTIIEDLRSGVNGNGWCQDHESDDELTSGTCNRARMKRRVFKKIEHLNEFIRNEVTPEIHERYAKEIEALIQKNQQEITRIRNEHYVEIKNKGF